MRESYITILMYITFVLVNGVIMLALSHFFGPRRQGRGKFDPYECGVPIRDEAHKRFPVKFYLIATLFILFDIETVFLIPWSVTYKQAGVTGFLYLLVFLAVLTSGFIYLWRRGALEWD
ncbi:MAG: NADH-quinone oxidoreductase subunit A [Candidatus Cloacimonetes bacterium 4572_55]|nr:MAG: NADH-quinone oxidoreductase subunit A [Candidatus Cloacimonetes bacterium 4572_55]